MITDGLTPIAILLFVGGVLGIAATAGLYLFARLTGKARLARVTLWLGGGGLAAYTVVLFIASFTSHDRELAPGEEKHICEIDCHLAYSVMGSKSEPLPGGHVRRTVTVRVRFDEQTIAPWRPRDAALSPNSRYVALVDGAGREYPGSAQGLARKLIPAQADTTDLIFDVPAEATGLRLVLRSADFETAFVIGHENSLLHGRTTFALPRVGG